MASLAILHDNRLLWVLRLSIFHENAMLGARKWLDQIVAASIFVPCTHAYSSMELLDSTRKIQHHVLDTKIRNAEQYSIRHCNSDTINQPKHVSAFPIPNVIRIKD